MSDKSLEKAIKSIVETAHPEKIILFGSRAVGQGHQCSDYDLLVIKEGVKKKRLLAQEIYRKFKNLGASIDVIVANSQEVAEQRNNPYLIYSNAIKSGKVVYEK